MRLQKEIGDVGELYVLSLLPGAEHMNGLYESRLPYDILWNSIKIDVKTTRTITKEKATFNVKVDKERNGIVLVFVAVREDQYYLWVDKMAAKVNARRNISDAVEAEQLQRAINEAHESEVTLATNEPVYTMIRIRRDLVEKLREEAVRERRTITMQLEFILEGENDEELLP